MSKSSKNSQTKVQLMEKTRELQRRLEEAEQTLEAIRNADVDALVMAGPRGERIFSLTGAEHIYRVIVETMHEAALMVDPEGTILFCNQRFCDLMKTPMQGAIGRQVIAFAARPQQRPLKRLLAHAQAGPVQRRLVLQAADGTAVPVQLSASPLQAGESLSICLVASDLTELEESANSIRVLREHEQMLQEANEHLQVQSEELPSQAEELRAQTEELTAAEATWRASEFRLAQAQRIAHLGSWSWDIAADRLYWSDETYRLFGLLPGEFVPRHKDFLRFVHPEDRPRVEKALQDALVHGHYNPELRIIRTDGEERYVHSEGYTTFDPDGHPLSMEGMIQDITERKQAEQERRERMKELVCLYAVSHDLQEDLSLDELCRRAVEHLVAAMQFPGLAVAAIELNGKRFTSENYAAGLSHGLQAAITGEGKVLGHLRVYYAQERPFLIPEEQNLVNGVVGALGTWLERQRAEETLRESREAFRALADNSPDNVDRLDRASRHLYVNAAAAQLFGVPPEEVVGKTNRQLGTPDPWAGIWEERIRHIFETGQSLDVEDAFPGKDGPRFWQFRCVPERAADGTVASVLAVARDITERKQAEGALRELAATLESKVAERTAQLEQRARQLQKLTLEISETEDRERRRMAEILHDDLQQQLAAAKFHVGVLRGWARYDASLQETAAQIDHMLKDAIETSRNLSHELSPAVMHHADFDETFRWLAGQVQAKHGLVVHMEAHGAVRSESEALQGFLYKAAQEFLFNVVKHARAHEARLRVRRFGRCLHLSVSDRGRGFDPQGLAQTAGFGLLNIRERVELLGGRMKIRSAAGRGSTFSLVAPDGQKTEDGKKTEKGAPSSVLCPPSSVLRVLLADDHAIVRQGLRALLSDEHDIEVVGEAANGREAVDLASRLKPDVIIMDVSMPLIEGDEATRQIKACLPRTQVIAISMYDQAEKREAMSRAGAERYVLKTAPSEELRAAIRGQEPDARKRPA